MISQGSVNWTWSRVSYLHKWRSIWVTASRRINFISIRWVRSMLQIRRIYFRSDSRMNQSWWLSIREQLQYHHRSSITTTPSPSICLKGALQVSNSSWISSWSRINNNTILVCVDHYEPPLNIVNQKSRMLKWSTCRRWAVMNSIRHWIVWVVVVVEVVVVIKPIKSVNIGSRGSWRTSRSGWWIRTKWWRVTRLLRNSYVMNLGVNLLFKFINENRVKMIIRSHLVVSPPTINYYKMIVIMVGSELPSWSSTSYWSICSSAATTKTITMMERGKLYPLDSKHPKNTKPSLRYHIYHIIIPSTCSWMRVMHKSSRNYRPSWSSIRTDTGSCNWK